MTSEPRILVVDDDDAIRALLQTVLRRRGFRADGARNGVDALEQLGARSHALLILDLMMPRMDGYEVLDHLSRQPMMTRPRVLVLTAGLEARPLPPTLVSDLVIGLIHKPFDIEMLVDIVAGYFSTASRGEEPTEWSSPN